MRWTIHHRTIPMAQNSPRFSRIPLGGFPSHGYPVDPRGRGNPLTSAWGQFHFFLHWTLKCQMCFPWHEKLDVPFPTSSLWPRSRIILEEIQNDSSKLSPSIQKSSPLGSQTDTCCHSHPHCHRSWIPEVSQWSAPAAGWVVKQPVSSYGNVGIFFMGKSWGHNGR